MAEEQDGKGAKYWKTMTSVSSVVAVCALLWGFNEHVQVIGSQSALNEANARLQALSKHDLPITVSFRQALMGSGLVVIFKNNSAEQIEVAAVFSSDATGQSKQVALVLPSGREQQFGHAEGWAFSAGQHIKLSNNNFRPAEYTVPQ